MFNNVVYIASRRPIHSAIDRHVFYRLTGSLSLVFPADSRMGNSRRTEEWSAVTSRGTRRQRQDARVLPECVRVTANQQCGSLGVEKLREPCRRKCEPTAISPSVPLRSLAISRGGAREGHRNLYQGLRRSLRDCS